MSAGAPAVVSAAAAERGTAIHAAMVSGAAMMRVGSAALIFAALAVLWPVDRFGTFMFAYVLANALAKVIDYGFALQLNRDVARDTADAAGIVASALWAKTALLVPLGGIAWALTAAGPAAGIGPVFLLLLAAEVAQSYALFFAFPLRGLGQYAAESAVTGAGNVLVIAAVAGTLALQSSPTSVAAAFAAGRLLAAMLGALTLARHLDAGWTSWPGRQAVIASLWRGLPFGVHVSVGALCMQVETLMLHWVMGPVATGVYQVGARLVSVALMMGDAVHTVYLRRVAGVPPDARSDLLRRLAGVLLVMGVAAAGAFVAASTSWPLSVLGEDYRPLATILPLAGLLVLTRFIGIPYGLSLTMGERQGSRAIAVIMATLTGFGIAFALVSAFGMTGAAVAALVNSTLLYALYAMLVHHSPDGTLLRRYLQHRAAVIAGVGALTIFAAAGGDLSRLALAGCLCAGASVLNHARKRDGAGATRGWDRRTAWNAAWRALELVLAPLTLVALAMPRDPRLWAFGSWNGTRFADNPRYLFEWVTANRPGGVRAVWISRRRHIVRLVREHGGEAYLWLSPRGLWIALHAGAYVFDSRIGDVNRVTVGRARTVNLWHGVPLKRIEADITIATHPIQRARSSRGLRRLAWRLMRPEFFERYDRLLAPSDNVAACLASAFRMDRERIIVAPYPRVDGICGDEGPTDGRRPVGASGITFLYAPTFRDAGNSAAEPIPIDWQHLESVLAAAQASLLVKLHPVDRRLAPDQSSFQAIRFVPADEDVYAALRSADVLITDYSSIYFDFLVVDRPVVFYAYDLDRYTANSRSLYFRYDEMTPGPVATDYEALVKCVSELLHDYQASKERWGAERARVRRLIHRYTEPPFSARTAAALQQLLAPATAKEAA